MKKVAEEIKQILKDITYERIYAYFWIRLNKLIETGKIIRKRWSTVINEALFRHIKFVYYYNDDYIRNEMHNIDDTISTNFYPDDLNPIPYSDKYVHEYDFHDFLSHPDRKREYPDIDKYRFVFRELNGQKDTNHVVLFIPGFTTEGLNMEEYLKNIDPLNWGFYSLNWSSFIWPTSCKSIFTWIEMISKIIPWRKNAIYTGETLARILTDNYIFKSKTVSLIGHSMGTEVTIIDT